MILYGIPNCDTCRKALKALTAAGHAVTLRDVRKDPLGEEEVAALLAAFGEALINKRSATWRGLSESERARPPADLLAAHPTLMKRPVCEMEGRLSLGWDAAARTTWEL